MSEEGWVDADGTVPSPDDGVNPRIGVLKAPTSAYEKAPKKYRCVKVSQGSPPRSSCRHHKPTLNGRPSKGGSHGAVGWGPMGL